MLVDVSNSFAPFDQTKSKQIGTVMDALAQHMAKDWSLGATLSVHPIDAHSVTADPICPVIEYEGKTLLKPATSDIRKMVAICVQAVTGRSQDPAKLSDIRNSINMAADSFVNIPGRAKVLVVFSDFVDTSLLGSGVPLQSLAGVSVLMFYGPDKLASNSPDYLKRIDNWVSLFTAAGSTDVHKLSLQTVTAKEVLAQLPNPRR